MAKKAVHLKTALDVRVFGPLDTIHSCQVCCIYPHPGCWGEAHDGLLPPFFAECCFPGLRRRLLNPQQDDATWPLGRTVRRVRVHAPSRNSTSRCSKRSSCMTVPVLFWARLQGDIDSEFDALRGLQWSEADFDAFEQVSWHAAIFRQNLKVSAC